MEKSNFHPGKVNIKSKRNSSFSDKIYSALSFWQHNLFKNTNECTLIQPKGRLTQHDKIG